MDFNPLKWISKEYFSKVVPPFSFVLKGDGITNQFVQVTFQQKAPIEEGNRTKLQYCYIDESLGLEFKVVFQIFPQSCAVDLVLYVTNIHKNNSPIIEDLQVFDYLLQPFLPKGKEIKIHYCKGSAASKDDFAPCHNRLKTNKSIRFRARNGRSSNIDVLPFFNIETVGIGGVFLAVGWSGQWASTLTRDKQNQVWFRLGMEHSSFYLDPGKTIRSPRLLLFPWRSSRTIDGHNAFRQFFLQNYAPHCEGKLVQMPLACYGVRNWKRTDEANLFTEADQKEFADGMARFKPEVQWIDAGWFEGGWPNGVGSWIIRKEGFPNGLRAISEYIKKYNMKLMVWFEPERVHEMTWLAIHHPEWCLKLPKNKNMLFNLGNPEARKWLIDYLSGMIEKEGISIFRLDFNQEPLPFWKYNDLPDCRGLLEIRHIEGLYELWDELRRRFPSIIFDNCASGGRRLDLETMSRCVALTRTDYKFFEPNGCQCHTYGVNFFLPTAGTFTDDYSPYKIRSTMTNGVMLNWDPFKAGFDAGKAERVLNEYREVRDLFWGDYYPLTPYSVADNAWCAYQFHKPEERRGMVLVFRRQKSAQKNMNLRFEAINATRSYSTKLSDEKLEVTSVDTTGDLLQKGLEISIPTAPGSVLLTYREIG